MSVAVCITTHNRYDVFKKTYAEIKKYLPKSATLIVVDDASDTLVKEATYRFEKNVGVARSKNKCLELAYNTGAEHIFLFDDDCYPLDKNWHKPYIESSEPHLMYQFLDFADNKGRLKDNSVVYQDNSVVAYSHARGCMIYAHSSVLDTIGGFDVSYGTAMNEHADWTNRIHNAHLTTFRIMDVPNSNKLIHSMDEHQSVATSIPRHIRVENLTKNRELLQSSLTSTKYCEFREQNNNIVLAAYFTGVVDPQRKTKWQTDPSSLDTLIDSVLKHDQKLVILHNNLEKEHQRQGVEYVKTECTASPYFQRWIEYYRYLRGVDVDNVFIVDATDTEMLCSPFSRLKPNYISVGDEQTTLNNRWLITMHPSQIIQQTIRRYRTSPMLNCGVIGGSKKDLMGLSHDIFSMYYDTNGETGETEMGAFNHLMYTKYKDRVDYGRHITTRFKKFEYNNDQAAWRHK